MISKRRPLPPPEIMRPVKPNEIGALLAGEQLGHFQLEEFIGGGGMGAVFRAFDNSLGRTVAVKVVSNERTDEETLRRFRNEAQSAARLDHPNIARVYYVGEDQGWNYIVFEYIEGVNIRDLVDHKGPLLLEEAISYTLQVAEALDHAAERDVVHRDIKPSNVLVMPDGRAKLVDMGLARLHHVDAPADDLTASGVTLGTFDYISPEQAHDPRSADVRSDLYSLGCTLYFMLTGMPPFPEGTAIQKLLNHSSVQPPDPRELRPEVPDEIAVIACKLMAKQPNSRHATPRALIGDLLAVADQLGMAGIASQAARHRRVPVWLGAVEAYLPWVLPLVALVLVAGGLDFFWRAGSAGAQQPIAPVLAVAPARSVEPESPAPPVAVDPTLAPEASPGGEPAVERIAQPGGDDPPTPGTSVRPPAAEPKQTEPGSASTSPDAMPATAETMPRRTPETADPAESEAVTESVTAVAQPAATEGDSVRLIVGQPEEFSDSTSTVVVATLEAAFRKANELTDVTTIELAFDDREVAPFTATLGRQITVKPAPGYRPQLTFRPTNSSIAIEKPMIRLVGGKLNWENTHFRVQMPYEPVDGCSLFSLDQIDTISLSDCWLTMRSEFDGTASFFNVRGPRQKMVGPDEGVPIIKSPSITMLRCVARGKATLVRATEGLPFLLSWENGLFSSSQRLIESRGVQRSGGAEISVDLYRVTVASSLGLCRVTIDDAAPAVPALDLACYQCVIAVDQNSPLIEHDGVFPIAKAESRLDRRGQQNVYEAATDVIWRIHSQSEGVRVYRWDDREEQANPRWFEEISSERGVRWAKDPELRPTSEYDHTPADFLLDDSQKKRAGFDEVLPLELPAASNEVEPAAGP